MRNHTSTPDRHQVLTLATTTMPDVPHVFTGTATTRTTITFFTAWSR